MTAAFRVRVQVLGPLLVSRAGDQHLAALVTQPRHCALLAYLLLARPRGLHARDTLLSLLWPEHDDARARQALRNALHGLRRVLGPDAIVSSGDHLVGVNFARFECDAHALETGHPAVQAAVADVGATLEPFAGFHVSRAPEFDAWITAERKRLSALVSRAADARGTGASPDLLTAAAITDASATPGRSPHDRDAYALYVRGNYMFLEAAHNGRLSDLERSRECFEAALAIKPDYALAIAGLSNYYAVAGARGVRGSYPETFKITIELSHRALELDPSLAIPHVHFGVKALYLDDDLPTARREFNTAVALDPRYAEGHRFLGIVLRLFGLLDAGIAAMEEAARLEPGIPMFTNSLAATLIAAGDDQRGEALLHETLRVDPHFPPTRDRLLRLYERQGRFAEAVAERQRAPALPGAERFATAWRDEGADGYWHARVAELRELITSLETRLLEGEEPKAADYFHPPALRIALAYAELGEWSKARAWKLQACATRPGLTPWFAAEPILAPIMPAKGAGPTPPAHGETW